MKALKNCFLILICAAFLVGTPFIFGDNSTILKVNATSGNTDYKTYLVEYSNGAIVYVAEGKIKDTNMQTQVMMFENSFLKNNVEKDLKNQTIIGVDGKEVKFDYKVDYVLGTDKEKDCDVLAITFENYQSFAKFNNIDLSTNPQAYQDVNKSLFFYERTLDFGDPYTRFFLNAPNTADLVNDFYQILNEKPYHNDLHYIFASDFRRTKVNSNESQYSLINGYYEYYFTLSSTSPNSVIVFDRFENSPIWYGIAVAATLVFIGIMYLVFKKQHKNKQPSNELPQNNTIITNKN